MTQSLNQGGVVGNSVQGWAGIGLQPAKPVHPAKLFFQILLLVLLACLQIDNDFKAIKKVFPLEKSIKAEVAFSLEKSESFQIQLVNRVEGKEPISANLSLIINDRQAREFQIKETGTKRQKFVAPQSLFKKGENRISWNLTTDRAGVILEEIKLVNYVGINPNIPVAWVVPDEHFALPENLTSLFARIFLLFCIIVIACAGLNRLLFASAQSSLSYKYLFTPLMILCGTLLYGAFNPYKILFPEETFFWLAGFALLAAQLHSILFAGANISEAKQNNLIIYLICLISVLAHIHYFKTGWYVQDDYGAIDNGGIGSFWSSGIRIADELYVSQGRYQPIRLIVFAALNHLFQEEYSAYYNFALHLANLLLFYFLLRKFKAEPVIILPTILLFSLFGKWRMMESPSTMVAGSGLNFFLIAITLLFLIKALETTRSDGRKTAFLSLSCIAYACLVLSYEVAFPMILPVIYTFIIFNQKDKPCREPAKNRSLSQNPKYGARLEIYHNRPDGSFWKRSRTYFKVPRLAFIFDLKNRFYRGFPNLKECSFLAPYFLLLIAYLLFFKLRAKGSYPGTTLSWSFSDIWTRLTSYINYTFSFRINLDHIGGAEIAILLLYFSGAVLALKQTRSSNINAFLQKRNEFKILLFGLILYISSVVLFTLNSWQSPSEIMTHHIYLMTVGSSILIIFSLVHAQWYLPGFTFLASSSSQKVLHAIFVKKYYRNLLLLVIFPLVLISEASYTRSIYEKPSVGSASIKPLKDGIQSMVDPAKTDAIIIKNFYHNYYGMTSVSGAFLQWFGFKYTVDSGRPILSASNDKIVYMGPLSFYRTDSRQELKEVANNRAQIFFLDDKTPLPYHDLIDFEKGTNLYQTQHVWGDQGPDEFRHYRLDAILKNSYRDNFLKIRTPSPEDLEWLIKNITRIELNNTPIPQVLVSGDSLFIDIKAQKNTVNYFFLTVVSTDKKFKKLLRMVSLQNTEEGVIARVIENIPIGVDSWGIG